MARAHLDKRPGDVAAMFDAIAGRYDLLNDILSAGQVRLWRRAVARITAAGLSERVLDLAAGTGPSSLTFTATGADCVACDFSLGMLQAGRSRLAGSGEQDGQLRDGRGRLNFVAGGALRLPFAGGRLVVCEFSTITIAPVDKLYRRYLLNVLPAIARRTARNPEAYEYLAESVADWPAQRELAGLIEAAGWTAVRWRDLSLGVVAVHVARRG